MKCKLKITDPAIADLNQVSAYISDQLQAKTAAVDFLHQVELCLKRICDFPELYAACLQNPVYRKAVIGNYVMLYQYLPEEETVLVHRFFYGRRDYYNDI